MNNLTISNTTTLDFRDVIRELEWTEKWPLKEGLSTTILLRNDGEMLSPRITGTKVDVMAGEVEVNFLGKMTIREVLARPRLIGSIVEIGTKRIEHHVRL